MGNHFSNLLALKKDILLDFPIPRPRRGICLARIKKDLFEGKYDGIGNRILPGEVVILRKWQQEACAANTAIFNQIE